ncbi:MAG: hypothetical protein VX916_06935 [Planctomycetota bacterium]|nr:hypothetical protein [Planctomycetota bacterium]
MTTIGKIFVVANLVLAMVILGSAGSLLNSQQVTRADVERETERADKAEAALDEESSGFAARERGLKSEVASLVDSNESLEVNVQTLQRNNDSLEIDNQQLRDDITKINTSLSALQQDLSNVTQRNNDLVDGNEELRTEAMNAKEQGRQAETARRSAEDTLTKVRADLEEQGIVLIDTQAELKDSKNLLEVAKSAGFDASAIVASPSIEANVASVDLEYGFVILDKGSNSEVQRGYTFEIYQGGAYKGRVQVDEVYADYCTAKIVIPVLGVPMERFDRASTHL